MGVSHRDTASSRGHRYDKPLQAMRVYLEEMDAAPYDGHPPEFPALRVLAALGPKMTALAGEMTDGVHPFLSTPEHTAATRATVGRDSLVAVEQAVLLTTDAEQARAAARANLERFLHWPNYRRHLARLGFDEDDLQSGGSDRLVDAVYAWGDEAAIQRRVADHLAAGADNVSLQAIPVGEVDEAGTLARLAPAVLSR
jgi:probable F420-dependent oxidoreductase